MSDRAIGQCPHGVPYRYACEICDREPEPIPSEPASDVNHPSHYISSPSGIECIEIVEHLTFNVGNAVKYCWRAGLKTDNHATNYQDVLSATIKDLQKAEWYIRREIKRLGKELK